MIREQRTVAVTGANGFIGANLALRLEEQGHTVLPITRQTGSGDARKCLASADVVFHLAGVNRSSDDSDFLKANRDFTAAVAAAIADGGGKPLLVHASSAKATQQSPYGRSKLAGEEILLDLAYRGGALVSIWRLPNLCGKWSRPNYNSVVATFCHNAARGLPLRIDDPHSEVSLLHVDDLIDQWFELMESPPRESGFSEARHVYHTTVGELAQIIERFAAQRMRGEVADVGTGLNRILYASFAASLPVTDAIYSLAAHRDARGSFVEMLKTEASGQISYFTAHPGATRGGHYHHSKVEKFLVAHGTGRFRFRHALNGETLEFIGSGDQPAIIETIPGWAHDITNIGDNELVVLTWANERFDPERPDTVAMPL